MINIYNIRSIAKYEAKTLSRGWFFRIFAILALIWLAFYNVEMFGNLKRMAWTNRAIPANIPYLNTLIINVVEAIIAIFLASDFIKKDKKLDTTEVIYTRPITNGEYVLGKMIGILILFIGLLLLGLVLALIFNFIRTDTPIVWSAYLFYPLLIVIPTFTFILGLSFTLMLLLKNQAVTYIILLGYIGLTLFKFKDIYNGLLDYMAFNIPMVYSDIIGFSNFNTLIWQRLTYFLIGSGFIFLTIRLMKRLPQTGIWNNLNTVLAITLIALGLSFGVKHYKYYSNLSINKKQFISLNNEYASALTLNMLSNKIELEHLNNTLNISSTLVLHNDKNTAIDTIILSLNPGFSIDSIIHHNKKATYIKKKQILKIIPEASLFFNDRYRCIIYYSGRPDETICNLGIPDEKTKELKWAAELATINKNSCIVEDNYLLLIPELLWYPIAGVGFNHHTFKNAPIDFTRFSLQVKTHKSLTAISAGKRNIVDTLTTRFKPENNLNGISLIVGEFERRELHIDGLDINLFIKPGHDYFSEYFANITDTIPGIIKEFKENYEYDELDLFAQFRRVNLVETPIQFHAYEQSNTQTCNYVQPEMILLPEKGCGLLSMDFGRYTRHSVRENQEKGNEKTTEQIETDIFRNFVRNTFYREGLENRWWVPGSWRGQIELQGANYTRNPYNIFPLYYTHVTGIESKKYSILNPIIEIYLKEGFNVSIRESFRGGMTDSEKANMAIKENSLDEIFTTQNNLVSQVINQTGAFIIKALKNRVGSSEFNNFLYYYIEDNYFKTINFEDFSESFYNEFKVDITTYFETINSVKGLPSFIFSPIDFNQTHDELGEVFLVKFTVSNLGVSNGLIDISFRMPGRDSEPEQRIIEVKAGQTNKVQLVLYERPRVMSVNTLISENIPSTFSKFLRSPETSSTNELEELNFIINETVKTTVEGEIIVDNEDPGFSFISNSGESKLKQYIESKKEKNDKIFYKQIPEWWTWPVWMPIAHSACYGNIIRSAYITRSGDGSNIARWQTVLDEAGEYDLYTYIPKSAMYGRANRNERGPEQSGRGRRGRPEFKDDGYVYTYVVSSNHGTEDVDFILTNIEEGWNKIGSFHFPADSVSVMLNNNIKGKRVFADAIKWMKK